MNSINACCHSAKLCAHTAQAFRAKWCCDLDVEPCETSTKRTCDRCGSLQKGGDVVATVREEQHPYNVARTSNNGVIATHELNCCLLPQCEALRTCRSGFPIATLVGVKKCNAFTTEDCTLRGESLEIQVISFCTWFMRLAMQC